MELGGGSESAAKRQRLSSTAAAGEDRISALPDDVLVLILLKLSTPAAARTRILSHRWRRIWALLPVLSFTSAPEPHWLRDALDGHKVLLRDLLVGADGATPESLAVWLPAAACRVSGKLTLKTYGPVENAGDGEEEAAKRGAFEFPCFEQATKISFFLGFQDLAVPLAGVFARLTGLHLSRVWLPAAARCVSGNLTLKTYCPVQDAGEEEAAQRGAFEFPCFEQATTISLVLGFQGLAVPPTGVFARLTGLHMSRVWFHGPGELGDAVSSPRCPCLKRLTVQDSHGLRDLAIHSESMLWMELRSLRALSRLTVVAPALKELTVKFCFVKSPPIANISAPLVTRLDWIDEYDPSSVHLGKMAHLQWLGTLYYLVYGTDGFPHNQHNQSCLSLLQRFEAIKSRFLKLAYCRY